MIRNIFLLLCLMCMFIPVKVDAQGYQQPNDVITSLVDAPLTPLLTLSPDKTKIALLARPSHPSIDEVAQKELRIGGIRINPQTNGSSRSRHYNGISLQNLNGKKDILISNLPDQLRAENVSWSPNGTKIAFTNTVVDGIELWLIDVATATAQKLTKAVINDALRGAPINWVSNTKLMYKAIPETRSAKMAAPETTEGPVVQENQGEEAAVRTYQDLLKNPYDEALFDYYATAQLFLYDLESEKHQKFGQPGIHTQMSPSPNGEYIFLTTLEKPYSYLVPYSRFPFAANIFDLEGKIVQTVAKIPLAENIPKGFGATRTGPRSFSWRADVPATLYWVEAQDEGNPKKKVEVRDRLFYLSAPFDGQKQVGIDFKLRYGGISWGDNDLAIANEYWWSTRQSITSQWNPSQPKDSKKVLFDRSTEDRYSDPGRFQFERNSYGRNVLMMKDGGNTLMLVGTGASSEGNRPFVDEYNLKTGKTNRLWRSEAPYYEYPVYILDKTQGVVMTRRESKKEPANYFIRDLGKEKITQVTSFENPFKAMEGVSKELIKYQRKDGVNLTGTLYLPAGYDKEKDGPLPTLMWAYPREYKSAKAAGQVSGSPHQFVRLYYGSPIFWVTQGYAVFDNFAMPIIGEGDEEPNETFVDQLYSGAEAAIDKLVDMGVTDRDRIGVGGHSYGAFMTANLLAHTDLFAAGIARSGAYNRTLTPFGFQREERTFWEAPEIYFKMSPFMHADKIKEPILLIHGEADNNSGTFPMQSKRFYAALKGHGATARLVMLPHESHGYRGRESILHMLWEQDSWLEKHVKNANKEMKPVKP